MIGRSPTIPLLVFVLLFVGGPLVACSRSTPAGGLQRTFASDSAVVVEARGFMESYARELLEGDRAAIAARYDRTGAYLIREAEKTFVPYDDIVARYARPAWSPPEVFEWRNLSYEPVGPDAVVVLGEFVWGPRGGGEPLTISYNALLERQDGELRIRVEDEKRIVDRRSSPEG